MFLMININTLLKITVFIKNKKIKNARIPLFKISEATLKIKYDETRIRLLISNFRRVLNVVCFLLGNSPASEFYMPTFRNTVCSIFMGR